MKDRGFASPDEGDALACTFAKKFARKDINASRSRAAAKHRVAAGVDEDPFGY